MEHQEAKVCVFFSEECSLENIIFFCSIGEAGLPGISGSNGTVENDQEKMFLYNCFYRFTGIEWSTRSSRRSWYVCLPHKRDDLLMISFLFLGIPGASGQKGEPGKYKIT
jgi:hypothetical protein